jgi:DNA-binding NarL/FixJ family response regulator
LIRVRLSLLSPALEAGVRALLGADPAVEVIGAAGALRSIDDKAAADVHIMTSTAFRRQTEQWREEERTAGIIILGAGGADVRRLRDSGVAWGALPMEVSPEELCAAVQAVANGLAVGTRPLLSDAEESGAVRGPLTEREVEILGMLSRGLANKQIAGELGISEHTVKFHVSSIYTKLNVSNRTEAVREGWRNGWIAL